MGILTGQQFGDLHVLVARVCTLDELTHLMRVDLDVRLSEIVAVSRPMLNVAFDLIEWLEPRERTRDFLRALRTKKADVPGVVLFCDPFIGAGAPGGSMLDTSLGTDPGNVHTLVVKFRAVFEERREWFGYLNAYKALHDVLHDLQDQRVPIAQAVQRFRAAPGEPLELLRLTERLNDELVADAENALSKTEPDIEFSYLQREWVGAFKRAVSDLAGALAPPNFVQLEAATAVLATLHNQQSALNRELVQCAKRLRTANLVRRIEQILAQLGERAAGLRIRLTRFTELCQRLTALTIDHDACQDVEPALASVTAPVVTRDLITDWPDTLAVFLGIAARSPQDSMAIRLGKYATAFDTAPDPKTATGQFTLLRDLFGRLFHKIDEDLLTVTDNLVREAELLGTELKGFK